MAFVVLLLAALLLGRRAFWTEPNSLVVVEYGLDLPSWPMALDGFRIAAVGDLHGGAPFIDERKLEEVALRITVAKPDLIVWLGDYVIHEVLGGKFMEPERVAVILSKAEALYGQIAIIGNHDHWLDSARVERAFVAAGIPFLRSQSRSLEVNGVNINLYGLDDFELVHNYWTTLREARQEWTKIPADEPLIVLSHSPDVFPWIPSRATLTLASHTHGGQVRLPVLGSLIVPSSFRQRFSRGHIVEEGRHLFVNPGIGTSIIPVRFGVPPEISILTLRALATAKATPP
jgi:predicted MPP superfamily phosphohydrolase